MSLTNRPRAGHCLARVSAFRLAALAVATLIAAGCNEPLSPPHITISPANKTASVGQTVQYTASVDEGTDKTVDERPPAWFSSNQNVATITTPAGVLTAKAVGTSQISVSFGSQDGTFYTEVTTLTVVASSAAAANVTGDGIVLVLGSSLPVTRGGP